MAKKKELNKVRVTLSDLDNRDGSFGGKGLEIQIPEAVGNPSCPDDGPIWIEYYQKKLLVHIWNAEQNPITIELKLKKKKRG